MKTPFLPRIALLAAAFSIAGMTAILADDTQGDNGAPPPPPPGGGHGHHEMLTADERAELKKDRDAVFEANPDLKTEEKALWEQMKQHMDKVDAAIIKEDPNAAPILAKMKAGHHHHGPPPPDDNNNQ